ncbi:MAG: SAM-dependent methyltransferase [Myxococcota bacterium]|nr:SAM-dependent methyltransferase [Myxococcota bacterium]
MTQTLIASSTARLVAALRARATNRPEPLCRDPWAESLAGDEGLELSYRHDRVYPASELWVALRTAWIDRRIQALAGSGRSQVVLLGAGLDTRAARLGMEGVRWFEVDQPASQALKLERLQMLEGYPLDAATHVPCNFEEDDFLDRLTASGFSSDEPALFIWEGVTPYLSLEAVRATTGRIAQGCHPQTVLIFDHLEKKLVDGRSTSEDDRALREMVDDLGEPFVFGINDPLPLLVDVGFGQVRRVSFDEVCLSFTGSYDRSRKFRFQHLVEASRDVLVDTW